MPYSKNIYLQAEEILRRRGEDAIEEARARREGLYGKIPRLKNLDAKIAETTLKIGFCDKKERAEIEKEITELRAEKAELLCEAGYKSNYLEPQYACKKCKDSGRTATGERCKCAEDLLAKLAFSELDIGEGLRKMSFSNFDLSKYPEGKSRKVMETVQKNCKGFCDVFPDVPNLLFSGKTGLGKTHLAVAIAKAVNDRGFRVCYVGAPRLFADITDRQFGRAEDGGLMVKEYFDCDLLIIDDLGSENRSEFITSSLLMLVNDRLVHGRKMIITTNLSLADISARYEDRIASRLVGEFKALPFLGEDLRQKK